MGDFELREAVSTLFEDKPKDCIFIGIKVLIICYKKCIEVTKDYIEK